LGLPKHSLRQGIREAVPGLHCRVERIRADSPRHPGNSHQPTQAGANPQADRGVRVLDPRPCAGPVRPTAAASASVQHAIRTGARGGAPATHHQHAWYVCEAVSHRVNKSLSDLGGTDVRIHGGTIRGVFGALCDMFVRKQQPSVQEMHRIYRVLRRNLPRIMRDAGARDPYGARVFRDLIFAARSEQLRTSRP